MKRPIADRSRYLPLVAAVLVLALAPAAYAERAKQGLVLDQNVQAAYNPLGAQLGTKIFYRVPLSDREGELWESTKLDIGVRNNLSPAYEMAGLYVDILPIAVFDFAVSVNAVGYFDALGYGFRSLGGYDAAFDEDALEGIPDGNELGLLVVANPTFQVALGPFAILDSLSVSYYSVGDGTGYFYEAMGGCPLKKRDLELFNDAYALYAFDFGLMVGLNDGVLYVPGSGYVSHTLQGVGVFNAKASDRLSVYAALTAGIYLADKYHQGEPRIAGQAGIALEL